MSNSTFEKAALQYQSLSNASGVEYADSHQLIRMLYDGAIDRLVSASSAAERNDIPTKGLLIGKAITIIDALRAFLDFEKGGDIARNLELLYDYMSRRLLEANIKNDSDILVEIKGLVSEIREAWVAIEAEVNSVEQPESTNNSDRPSLDVSG